MGKALYFNLCMGGTCNNRCLFCDAGFDALDLPFEFVLRAMEENSIGVGDIVIFSGGEPTLYDQIGKLVEHAMQRGADVYMQSNGRRFRNHSFALHMIESGLRRVLISLYDSTPEIHDYLTHAKGSFEDSISGLKNLFELSQEYPIEIEINTVVCKANFEGLPKYVDFIKRNFPSVKFLRFCALNMSDIAMKNIGAIGIRLTDTSEMIRSAVDRAIRFRIPVALDYIPLCVLEDEKYASIYQNEREHSVFEPFAIGYEPRHKQKWIGPSVRFKPPQCLECEHNIVCKGIHKRYAAENGVDEFVPFR